MGLELQGTGKVSPCVVRETKLSILVLGQCWHTEGTWTILSHLH